MSYTFRRLQAQRTPGSKRIPVVTALFVLVIAGIGANPLYMWHLGTDDADLYMVGSIHALTADFYPLPEVLDHLSRRADILVLELDPRDMAGTSEAQAILSRYGVYADGHTLDDVLPVDLNRRLRALIESFGLDWNAVRTMRPWLLAVTLEGLAAGATGYSMEWGLDIVLADRHGEKPILELESVEEQLDAMANLDEKSQILYLKNALESAENPTSAMDLYLEAWSRGDPTMLEGAIGKSGTLIYGEVFKSLILDRNIAMADRIEIILENHSGVILLAVGAAHFVGPWGLQELLARRGYVLNQVDEDSLLPIP